MSSKWPGEIRRRQITCARAARTNDSKYPSSEYGEYVVLAKRHFQYRTIVGRRRAIEVIMRLREVHSIQREQHRAGIIPISICEAACAQRVDDGNCQQCGLHPVTRNVEEIKGEPLRIDPMITKPISAKLRRSGHEPVR